MNCTCLNFCAISFKFSRILELYILFQFQSNYMIIALSSNIHLGCYRYIVDSFKLHAMLFCKSMTFQHMTIEVATILRVTKHALYMKKAYVTINYNLEGKQYSLDIRDFLVQTMHTIN